MSCSAVSWRGGWRGAWLAALLSLGAAAAGCGAKTGLLIEDAGHDADEDAEVDAEEDAEVDADPDVEADAEPDEEIDADPDVCRPDPVEIDRRRAEVMFSIDRSRSMEWTLEGDEAGWPPRWVLLRDALSEALYDVDHLLEIGAKFFPLRIDPGEPVSSETSCGIDPGIELVPAPFNTGALLGFFDSTQPEGGTPTALALAEARLYMTGHTRPGVAQFVVLATDGGPNCNDELTLPCTCTGTPDMCEPPIGDVYNCLDEERTLDVITRTAADGIPVFVIGIDDPNRDDLADFLDEMAVAGGRPRSEPGERRFFSVQHEGELRDALDEIVGSIARCLFVVDPALGLDPRLEIRLDGEPVPRDETRLDGWDWTNPGAGELTLFGPSCDRAFLPGSSVTAVLACVEDAG